MLLSHSSELGEREALQHPRLRLLIDFPYRVDQGKATSHPDIFCPRSDHLARGILLQHVADPASSPANCE